MAYPYEKIGDYLEALEKSGELKRIDVPIKVGRDDTELDALTRHLQNTSGPAVMLTNPVGLNMANVPLLINLFGSRKRAALMLGEETTRAALEKSIKAHHEPWPEPVIVDPKKEKVACKEVVIKGDDIDLRRDFPKAWFHGERQVYLTSGLSITKDPVTGTRNMGWYRYGMLDVDPEGKPYPEEIQKRHLTSYVWWNPPITDIGRHFAKAVNKGQPLQVAIALTCEPALHIAGGTSLATGRFEALFAGALRGGKPVEMVKCETVDLEVPTAAEWILEGEILPGKEELDGPHGNYFGYYDPIFTLPLTKVNCITRRKDAMMYFTYEMKPPFDHAYVADLHITAELMAELQPRFPEVENLAIHPLGWGNIYVVQLSVDGADKPAFEYGRFIIHAVWGSGGRWARMAKFVIVVGPDIDPFDMDQVMWALSTRVQPISDVIVNQKGAALLDPSAPEGLQGNRPVSEQVGIDATIKVPERFTEYAPVAEAPAERVKEVKSKLKKYGL